VTSDAGQHGQRMPPELELILHGGNHCQVAEVLFREPNRGPSQRCYY
jgi:hypothetical protein